MSKNNDDSKKDLQLRKTEVHDPMDDILGGVAHSSADRSKIEKVARQLFGDGEDSAELVLQIVENMIAIAEARARISDDLRLIGGQLINTMHLIKNSMIAKSGNKTSTVRKAATMGYRFFEGALGVKYAAARQYMRCYEAFIDNTEAIRVFNVGELDILAADHVTDEQVATILAAKKANENMTREDIRKMLATLQKQEEALADRQVQVENYKTLLEESKTAHRVAEDEARRLQDQLEATAKLIADKEAQLKRMDSYYTGRQAGLANLEKDLADKDKEIQKLNEERNALLNRKPEVQIKEVPTAPAGYTSISDSLEKRSAELKVIEEQLTERRAELAQLELERQKEADAIEAANRVQAAMQDVMSAFETFAGKLSTAQVAVQACDGPAQHEPLIETLAAMMRKHLTEIETSLRK
ncbi:hypothetical protein SAMN05446927_8524 [Caballeronia arationis]|jgi:hypothetical protein|uniref:Chromosome partition protein Smc n=1 Tax=Caballeronia arationis TaxID=1777142 RepID=A0A7Z7IFK5_9BURK|nr:hypothetical protein [Caballeronia arationis]SOE91589.1 hypothetical protein SAMN05446927_8524 [Caballeronia arationis]